MTEEFINDYTITIAELFRERFDDIENHSLGKVKSGVSVGFDYLDAMTHGLPRGSLIVLGGRPSMGKTTSFTQKLCYFYSKLISNLNGLYREGTSIFIYKRTRTGTYDFFS